MNRTFSLLFLTFIGCTSGIDDKEWGKVKASLTSIRERDQQYRKEMDSIGKVNGWQSKEMKELWINQKTLDSANLLEIKEIIQKHGFPPKEKVGEGVETIFLVLQHSTDSVRAEYCDLVVAAAKKGDLPMSQVAFYQDQVLIRQQLPQEFGSQIWIDNKLDPKTGEKYDSLYVWKIRDPENVNKRRKSAGLDSLEIYLRHLDIDPLLGYTLRRAKKPVIESEVKSPKPKRIKRVSSS